MKTSDKESKKNDNKFEWVIWVTLVAIAVVLIFYFGNFHGSPSDSHDVWGQFGDFFGGVLNPILSFLNIYLLIRLTQLVSQKDDERSNENLRYNILKEFKDKVYTLDLFDKTSRNWEMDNLDKPNEFIKYLKRFQTFNGNFFTNEKERQLFNLRSADLILTMEGLLIVKDNNMIKFNDWLEKNTNSDWEMHQKLAKYGRSAFFIDPTIVNWRGSESVINDQEIKLINLMEAIYLRSDLSSFEI